MKSISDIKHIFYINLEKRNDRKIHIENQLSLLGLTTFERFNAIKLTNANNGSNNGRIGCSMSHFNCLKLAKERNYDHLLICEDDAQFLNPELFKKQFNSFLDNNINWDVLLFAGNNVPPYKRIDNTCIQVSHCQTTTCYLVKNHYFDVLMENIKEGIKKLMMSPQEHIKYAIDKYWLTLQKKDKWFLITPLTVIQREDYSDIEERRTNYGQMMIDLDKPHLLGKIVM